MNQYPQQELHRQFPPRNVQPSSFNPQGMHIPPPPLPPWPNPSAVIPPPPLPPHFSQHQIPPNIRPQQFQPSFATFHSPQFEERHCTTPVHRALGDKHGCALPLEDKCTNKPSTNQIEVDSWLRSRKVVKTSPKTLSNSKFRIREVRVKINSVLSEMRELENDVKTLAVMLKTVTPAEWDSKCDEIEAKKRALSSMLHELQMSDGELRAFKQKCSKRTKKREWLKRRKGMWKKQKEEEKVRMENLHVQLDNWLQEMQEAVERTQREEELKKEADAVLWGITQKKNESRRQISLLSALLELRQVRVKRLTATGNPVSQSQIQTFNTVIERLKKMWGRHMEECLLEEQVLRGMLTQQEAKEDPVKTYKKLVLQEWEKAIFGSVRSLDTDVKGDELLQVRRSWDQFAVPMHTVLSTTVPPGWVLPAPPGDQDWHQLLKY